MTSDPVVAGGARLLDHAAHVVGGHELPLLDVDRPAGLGRGHHEVGLAAEEGGDLEHVADLGGRLALRRLVDVGEHRQAGLLLTIGAGRAAPPRGRGRGSS